MLQVYISLEFAPLTMNPYKSIKNKNGYLTHWKNNPPRFKVVQIHNHNAFSGLRVISCLKSIKGQGRGNFPNIIIALLSRFWMDVHLGYKSHK